MVVVVAPSKGGKLMMSDWQKKAINEEVKRLDGQDVRVWVTKDTHQRTPKQNRYYWGVVIKMISDHTGYTKEEMHEALKNEYLGRRFIEFGGKEIELSKSTKDIDTKEMSEYTERCRQFAAEFLQLNIPDPVQAAAEGLIPEAPYTVDPVTGEVTYTH